MLGFRDADVLVEGRTATRTPRPIVFLGFARQASSLLEELIKQDASVVDRITVVDFNPEVRAGLEKRRRACHLRRHQPRRHAAPREGARGKGHPQHDSRFGAQGNVESPDPAPAAGDGARCAKVIVNSEVLEHAREMYHEGAAYVLIPRFVGAAHLAPVVFGAEAGEGVGAHRPWCDRAARAARSGRLGLHRRSSG